MFPSAEAAVTAPPPGPCPRRLLAAARHLAAGLPESMAAGLAGLPAATLRQLRDDPDFDGLLDDCRAFEASPKAERNAVLERLTRAAIEQALADARVGAIPAAMRLLGLVPSTRPPGAASPDGEDAPGFGELLTCELPAVMRGVRQDDEGEWVGPDGLPVMPGRPLAVMAGAPGGPVRVLDIEPATVPPGFLEGLDEFDRAQAHAFNRGAYPSGGPQWDPVTRTLWCWGEPPEGPPRTDDGETRSAEADHLVTSAGLPGAAPAHAGGPVDPAPEPLPALPAPAHPAAGAVQVTPPDALEARVRRLLECAAAPAGPADTDLAEAICSLRWPNWPAYRGALDLAAVRRALHGRQFDERTLTRLGGSAFAKPAAAPMPPPRPPPPPPPPPDEPRPRRRPASGTSRRRRAGNVGRAPP